MKSRDPPMPLGDAVEPVGQQLQIAGHGRAEDEQFRLVGHLAEVGPLVGEATIDLRQFGQTGRIDKQPVHAIEKVVAGGARQQPLVGQGLFGGEDFFRHDVEREPGRVGTRAQSLSARTPARRRPKAVRPLRRCWSVGR